MHACFPIRYGEWFSVIVSVARNPGFWNPERSAAMGVSSSNCWNSAEVRTCRLEPAGLAVASQWLADRRALWDRRLDKLGELLPGPDQTRQRTNLRWDQA
jgi:hypothetical protein